MSSTSAPFGFRPSFHNSGQMRPKAYTIASTYAANIFQGDPVKLTDNGVIQLGSSDGTRDGTTDGVALLGIFAGCQYLDASGKPTISPFWPSGMLGTPTQAHLAPLPCKRPWAKSATGPWLRLAAQPAPACPQLS